MEAAALVRAARLYQEALWIAEGDPSSCWVMLVSAVETAAASRHVESGTAVERLRSVKPDLVSYLEGIRVPGLVERVADEFADTIRATKKFVDFILDFLPEPPTQRPPEWAQVDWDRDNIAKAARTIYKHRSKALHEGTPFPLPMCLDPISISECGLEEKPTGTATTAHGVTWYPIDLPMHLYMFEYLTRQVLLAWWRRLSSRA
jgi:hypothetical protein